ncbi:MAG: hypothetical protein ACOYJF_11615 [Prevotella sp.]|jgi:tetratricopeptide (TPR) repeat protein
MTLQSATPHDDNTSANILQAQAFAKGGQLINAVALLTQVIADIDRRKADRQAGSNQDDDAADEPLTSALLLRGQTLLKMGDATTAGNDADRILGQHADHTEALMLKARSLTLLHREKEAEECFSHVLRLQNENVDALRERGRLRLALGDKNGAEADAKALLAINPEAASEVNGSFQAKGTEQIPYGAMRAPFRARVSSPDDSKASSKSGK